nr:hypothetical protein [Tanacetum cinerariifolium]
MQTRSSSRLVSNPSSNPTPSKNPNPKGHNRRRSKQRIEEFNLDKLSPPIVTMADQPRILLEKEHPQSIFTWDDLVSKFINQFFPPSKTTNPRNEITNFQQGFDESFSKAWDRLKDLLRACPRHRFLELHQLDTFYNALNSKDQDSLNSAAGGNFLDKMPRECLAIIESKFKVRYLHNKPVVAEVSTNTSTSGISLDVAELKDMVKALLLDKKSQNQAPTTVKVVEESCVTYGGAHSYRNYPATDGNIYRDNIQEFVSQASAVNYNQGNTSYRPLMMNNQNCFIQNQNQGNNFNHEPVYQPPVFQPPAYQAPAYQDLAPQTQGVSKEDFSAYVKANDAVMRNMQTQAYVKANDAVMRNMQTQGQKMQNQLTNLTELITKFVNSNSASTLSSDTLPSNSIANPRSDLKEITTRSGVSYDGPQISPPPFFLPKVVENEPEATKDIVDSTNNGSTEDVQPQKLPKKLGDPDKFLIPYDFPRKAECLALADLDASINLMPLSMWNKLSIPDLSPTCMTLELADRLISRPVGVAEDVYVKVALVDLGASINLMPLSVWNKLSLPDLSPTCMTLELADRLISHPVGVAEDVFVKVGTFHFPADFVLVDFDADPRVPLILRRSFLKTGRALIDVFEGELTLRVGKEAITFILDKTVDVDADPRVPLILGRSFLKTGCALIDVYEGELTLRVGNKAITFDLDQTSRYFTNYDAMSVNRIDLIDTGRALIDVFEGELTLRVGKEAITFILDKTLRYSANYSDMTANRIDVIDMDCEEYSQEVLGFSDMCMMAIFHDMIEKTMEVFMDDFSVFRNSFQSFLSHLEKMLKSHKISKEGIEVDKAVVYAFDKFLSYLIMNKIIVYTDHSALKYLFAKKDSKARLLRWVPLLQEFTFKVIDTKRAENLAADHLSRLENSHQNVLDPKKINKSFPLETLKLENSNPAGMVRLPSLMFIRIAPSSYPNPNFKVNGHRLKHYFEEDVTKLVVPDLQTFPKDH